MCDVRRCDEKRDVTRKNLGGFNILGVALRLYFPTVLGFVNGKSFISRFCTCKTTPTYAHGRSCDGGKN